MPPHTKTQRLHDRILRYLRIHVSEAPYYEYVSRSNATEGVTIIAVTEAEEIVLVRQHRIPCGGPVIELPAGLVGDENLGETPQQAVARELREETGFAAAATDIRLLAKGPVLAGLTDEVNGLYLASPVTKTGPGGGVAADGEHIDTLVVPLATALDELARHERNGCLVDLKIYAGLHFLQGAQR